LLCGDYQNNFFVGIDYKHYNERLNSRFGIKFTPDLITEGISVFYNEDGTSERKLYLEKVQQLT